MLIFLFSSLAIRAVGKAAQAMIEEVRRQFKANPKIMTGQEARLRHLRRHQHPSRAAADGHSWCAGRWQADYRRRGPWSGGCGGLPDGGTIGGILMALVMNNGGGAWDNAKKFIEAGFLKDEEGNVLGKNRRP